MPESKPLIGHAAFEPVFRPPGGGGLLFLAEVGYVLIERPRFSLERYAKAPELLPSKLLGCGPVCTLSDQSSAVSHIRVDTVRFVAECLASL